MNLKSFLHEHDIVLSVGSGSVTGAIIERTKGIPKILFTHESHFPVKKNIEGSSLVTYMLSATHTCLSSLHKHHKGKIKKVQVVLASPWFSSSPKTISEKKPAPFVVNKKLIDSMVADYFDSHSGKKSAHNDFLMENSISHIRLNGYETANPYGHTAESIEVSLYASVTDVHIKEKIEAEIFSVIHPESVVFHSAPFVTWSVLNTMFAPQEDVVSIDIGSETTDILVVRRGSIEKSASLPLGINHLYRKTALAFETYPELAKSLVRSFSLDILDQPVREKINGLVSAYAEEWGIQFFQIFDSKDGTHSHFIPQKAFFLSDKGISNVFGSIIGKHIADATGLSRQNISNFVEYDEHLVPNVFIVLAAVYTQSF